MNLDYPFINVYFAHYEAFGGPFFNHFIGWLTNFFSKHPHEYLLTFTALFWGISILIWMYAILKSWEVKQSFKFWYDWEMPWRNPFKKIFLGNIFGRYFLALTLMYTVFLPIPIIQMTPVVGSSSSGFNDIKAWLVNDMKTSVGKYDADYNLSTSNETVAWSSLNEYRQENHAVAHLPLIFVPISMFESFYYGFPNLDLNEILDIDKFTSTGKYLLKYSFDADRPTVLSCLDKELSLKVVNEQETGAGSIRARIRQQEMYNKFRCTHLNENSSAAAAATNSFAAVLFGKDVVSDVYRDFFSPMDDLFEILMINSYSGLLNRGINARVSQSDGLLASDSEIFSMGIFKDLLTSANQSLDTETENLLATLSSIHELNNTMSTPKELIDLAFWQILESGKILLDSTHNDDSQVREVIWARNGVPPTDDLANEVWDKIKTKAANIAPDSEKLKDLELIYINGKGADSSDKENFKTGIMGGVFSIVNDYEFKKDLFEPQLEKYFGYNNSEVDHITGGASFALEDDGTSVGLKIKNDAGASYVISIPWSSSPTQSSTLTADLFEYKKEARNNVVYKKLDRMLISTVLSYAYIANIHKRLNAFNEDLKKWSNDCNSRIPAPASIKACITNEFKASNDTSFSYTNFSTNHEYGPVNGSLFGYYPSEYFQLAGDKTLGWKEQEGALVFLPIDVLPTSQYDVNKSYHAQELPFASRYLVNDIWATKVDNSIDTDKYKGFLNTLKVTLQENNYGVDPLTTAPAFKEQVNMFFNIIEGIGGDNKVSGSYYDSGLLATRSEEKINSLAQWGSIEMADGQYTDKYKLESEFTGLFSADGLFFKDESSPLHGIDPDTFTPFKPTKEQAAVKSFATLELYYAHHGVISPWSGSSENEVDYTNRRAILGEYLAGNQSRAAILDFKSDFLDFVMAMRPYVTPNADASKMVFKENYIEGLSGRISSTIKDTKNIADTSFITVLAMVLSTDIISKTESLNDQREKLEKARIAFNAAMVPSANSKPSTIKELNEAYSAAEADLLSASINTDSGGDTSILGLGLIIEWVWKGVTMVLSPIRDLQNTIVIRTNDNYSLSGYELSPEFLIGSYGYSEVIGDYSRGSGKVLLPTGAVQPGDSHSTVYDTIVDGLKKVGIWKYMGMAALAYGGSKIPTKIFKKGGITRNTIALVKGKSKTGLKWAKNAAKNSKFSGLLKGAKWVLKTVIFLFFMAFGLLFWAVLNFLFVLLRLVAFGILAGIIGFFMAAVVYPINFFFTMVTYSSKDNAQSTPIEELFSKLPKSKDTFIMASKQLSVWILSVTAIFILVFVHKHVFYPFVKTISFEAWLNSVGGESISNWIAVITIFFVAAIYYFIIKYTYKRLMKYMESITVSLDTDVVKGAKEMMAKNSSMFDSLQKMSSSNPSKGIARK